jgi:hypothetical protein
MPDAFDFKPYKTQKRCPVCAQENYLYCAIESVLAGPCKQRHLECRVCNYQTQDVINQQGTVVLEK